MRIQFLILIFLSLTALISAQDSRETEESNIPKKILRKYRIRRPVIVDENGIALTQRPNQRLRRVRVKQPQPSPPPANNVAIEATPEALLDARFGTIRQQQARPQPQPQAQALEQQQQQQVLYNEQQVVEPVRVVPQYRKATSSSTRSALLSSVNLRPTSDSGRDEDRKPAVGTTRNYSHINEDGSFTFGYEGEDGSFKEETRGTDCVVRGKYGYVDPDGVRREFSYVSGNPCDPNNPNPEEEDDELAAPPTRAGIRQRVPLLVRRPLNQEEIQQGLEQTTEERVPEEQLALYRATPRQRIRPQPQPQRQDVIQPTTYRPRVRITQPPPTTPPPALEEPQQLLARAFPRFRQTIIQDPALEANPSPRPFNFDQELQQLQQPEAQQQIQYQPQRQQQQPAAQQQVQYQQRQPQHFTPAHTFPQRQVFGGANAASLFNTYEQQAQQQPEQQPAQQQPAQQQGFGNYRTELVYDPASGQYTSVLVQDIPKTNEEFTLTQRLRAFVNPTANNQLQYQPQPQFQYYQQPQQQQQQLERQPLFERTLYHPLPGSISRLHADAMEVANSPASGQIDAFLRNLNIAG